MFLRFDGFGFNEAGARAPRILVDGMKYGLYIVEASMRPGRARPGYTAGAAPHRHSRERFNEAGARAPRIRGSGVANSWRAARLQ